MPWTRRKRPLRFKTQLILSFMTILTIVMFGFSVPLYLHVVKVMKNQLMSSTMERFSQADYNIGAVSNETDRITKQLMVNQTMVELLNLSNNDDTKNPQLFNSLLALFTEIMNSNRMVHSIYYIGDNGVIVGGSASRTEYYRADKTAIPFFKSDLYLRTQSLPSGIVSSGSLYARDFDFQGYDYTDANTHLISFARSLKDVNQIRIGTVIVNLYEASFTNVYNNANHSGKTSMYIANERGIVISSNDPTKLMSRSEGFSRINHSSLAGNVTATSGSGKELIVYRKLGFSNWTIIGEIPYRSFYSEIRLVQVIILVMFLVGIITAYIISAYWVVRVTRPLTRLNGAMRRMELGELDVHIDEIANNEFGLASKQFNRMSRSLVELVDKVKEAEDKKRVLEIEALQAQINPHFLYNALNAIKWMAFASNTPNVGNAMTTLGNVLRPIFKDTSPTVSLEQELSFLADYVTIMNYRFGEGIKLSVALPEELAASNVLKFILQPIVENCIVHGISGSRLSLEIDVSVRQRDHALEIQIVDNGEGMTEERLAEIQRQLVEGTSDNPSTTSDGARPRIGIGLMNVQKRVQLYYGEFYGLQAASMHGEGTVIVLRLPLNDRNV